MAVQSAAVQPLQLRWLRGRQFDLAFILGLPAMAILTASVVIWFPKLLWPVILLDIWFLGYHHVISTYTRLCFDRESFEKSKFLLFVLFPAVALVTLAVAFAVGIWAIITIYFYWQWFHYTRQSWGISRAYRAKEKDALYEDGWLDQAIFYALPVLGIMNRSAQMPNQFLGFDLAMIPVTKPMLWAAFLVAGVLMAYWVARRIYAFMIGRLPVVHTLYMLSHFLMFSVGYLLISDVTVGWLAINSWHNAQYILFVWLFNTKRFKDGIDPKARFLSTISQPGKLPLYLVTCVAITGVVYFAILGTMEWLFFAGVSATIVIYQIMNFHHYVVDSMIWKVRSQPMQKTLELGH